MVSIQHILFALSLGFAGLILATQNARAAQTGAPVLQLQCSVPAV